MRSSNRFRPGTTSVTCLLLVLLQCGDRFSTSREQMVRAIEARGIHNAEVIAALRATPRHLFVPLALQPFAYEDRPLPIGNGATISQPFIVAWMTSLLDPAKTNRVLEIGTGSGYQAAVLSRLVREVYTIEIVPELKDCDRDQNERIRSTTRAEKRKRTRHSAVRHIRILL